MPLFKYKAMTGDGKKVEDKVNATTREEILDIIRTKKLYPITIEEVKESKSTNLSEVFSKVKAKDLYIFCRQFYTLLNAGSDILNSVNILYQQTEGKALKESLNKIYEDIQKGLTLSEAMRNYKNIFPELLVNMIEAGEQTGSLNTVLERMTDYYEKENKLNNKIKGAMVYPMFLGILSIGTVSFLLTFVMPTFTGMFLESGVELPGITQVLLNISNFMKSYWYAIIMLIIVFVATLASYFKTEKGSRVLGNIKLKLPIIKTTNEKIITSRFTRNLSTILSSGVNMIKAIEIVSTVIGNKVVQDKLMETRDKVMKGIFLAEAIKDIDVFPPMLISMVKIGEESGELDEILAKTADFYDQEVEERLSKMIVMLEPIMILVMGLLVGFIVIAMMLPMFDMMKTVT